MLKIKLIHSLWLLLVITLFNDGIVYTSYTKVQFGYSVQPS